MKIAAKIVLIVLICFCFFAAKAQPIPGAGCLAGDSRIYLIRASPSSYNGLPAYSESGQNSLWTTDYDITTYPCFTWTPGTPNGCYIKRAYWWGGSYYEYGTSGTFSGTSGTTCLPLDDYIPLLALIVSGISFFYIRRFGAISG